MRPGITPSLINAGCVIFTGSSIRIGRNVPIIANCTPQRADGIVSNSKFTCIA
jgi:acetyltransferase-like isoleucine patch superfamily enzyme